MELGQKLKQARLEAGLSQRQLCGDTITRNMLSRIENGSARPSMDTLRFLAERLGKTVSYFLEEEAPSPNQALMAKARHAFDVHDLDGALKYLADFQDDDGTFDWERNLLTALCRTELAEAAIRRGQMPYAQTLLEQAQQAGQNTPYWTGELERWRLLLLAQACPSAAFALPVDDRELLARGRMALEEQNFLRAAQYLDAAEDHTPPLWNYLRGQAHLGLKEYDKAKSRLLAAETAEPKRCAALLEQCCLAQGDYKGAYTYACKLREFS